MENKPTILFFGDVHVHGVNEFSNPTEDGLTTLLHQARESLLWVALNVRQHRPDVVVCMGDITHVPGLVDAASLSVIWQGFSAIICACEEVRADLKILVGNHDAFYLKEGVHKIHSIPFFEDYLVTKPRVFDHVGFTAGYYPYTKDFNAVEQFIQRNSDCTFFATHVDALGTVWNSSKKASIGVRTGVADSSGIPVFNGHHHHPEIVGKWHNVGSLMYRSFHDSISTIPRGLVIFSGGIPFWKENPHTDIFHTIRPSEESSLRISSLAKSDFAGRLHLRVYRSTDEEDLPQQDAFKSLRVMSQSVRKIESRLGDLEEADDPVDIFDSYADVFELSDELYDFCVQFIEQSAHSASPKADVYFRKASGSNFMSFESFELDLEGSGVLRIDGENLDAEGGNSNMAGKSALLELIAWTITGKTVRGARYKNVLRRGAERVSGRVEFSKDDIEYCVVRSWSSASGTQLSLFSDGEDISKERLADTQAEIVLAVGLSEDDFFQVLYVDMENRFVKLSDTDKKSLIERISGGAVFALAEKSLKKRREKSKVDLRLMSAEQDVAELSARISQQESSVEGFRKQVEAASNKTQIDSDALVASKQKLESELEDLKDLLSDRRNGLSQYSSGVFSQIQDALDMYNDKLDATDSVLWKAERDYATAQKQLHLLEGLGTSGECPTCLRDYSDEHNSLHSRIIAAQIAVTEAEKLRNQHLKRKDTLQEMKNSAQQKRRELEASQTALLREIHQIEASIRSTEESLKTVDSHVGAIEGQANLLKSQLVSMEQQLCLLKSAFSVALEECKTCSEQVAFYEKAAYHLGASGVRSYAVDYTLNELNQIFSVISEEFGGDSTVTLSPETATGSGVLQRIQIQVSPSEYVESSKGERRRVELVIQLGLRFAMEQRRGHYSILVLDECDDNLDEIGARKLLDYLAGLDRRVFFISHNPVTKAFCPESLTVVRSNGLSRIEG